MGARWWLAVLAAPVALSLGCGLTDDGAPEEDGGHELGGARGDETSGGASEGGDGNDGGRFAAGAGGGAGALGGDPSDETGGVSGGEAAGGIASTQGGASTGGGASTEGGASTAGRDSGGAGGEEACDGDASPEGLVYEGDLTIASAEDLEAAKRYSSVAGDLIVNAAEVELPLLTRVGGDVGSSGTVHLRLPNLREVGGEIYYYLDGDIVTLDFRSLERVGGQVYIHRNLALRELQLDSLREAEGCQISANTELPDCFLDVVSTRFSILRTTAPECTCTRSCGVVTAHCDAP